MSLKAPPLTQGEKDFLAQICRFAEATAINGVRMDFLVSPDGAPVLCIVAIGEQAMALQKIVLDAAIPQSPLVEVVSSFEDAGIKGH